MRVEWLGLALALLAPVSSTAQSVHVHAEPNDDENEAAASVRPSRAGTATSGKSDGQPEFPAGSSFRPRPRAEPRLKTTEGILLTNGESVNASDALDEMLDELAADIARLGVHQASPVLLDRVRLSDNMDPEFATIVEARLAAALFRGANASVLRCLECWSARSRVEDNTWVVTKGITRKEDLDELAAQYDAKTVLSVSLTLQTAPNALAMDVELIRASDASILFAESYRVHPHTAMLYRGADSAQSREERLKDLEARINARPQFGHGVLGGTMLVPASSDGAIWGAFLAYRVFEKFGVEREYRLAIQGGGFLNTTQLSGAVLGVSLQRRLGIDNVYAPSLWVGGSASAFITGSAGNSAYLTANAEYQMVHRFALQAGLGYLIPFRLGTRGQEVGGVVPQVGGAVTW